MFTATIEEITGFGARLKEQEAAKERRRKERLAYKLHTARCVRCHHKQKMAFATRTTCNVCDGKMQFVN